MVSIGIQFHFLNIKYERRHDQRIRMSEVRSELSADFHKLSITLDDRSRVGHHIVDDNMRGEDFLDH